MRYFGLVKHSKNIGIYTVGRYTGFGPKMAASKCASKIFHKGLQKFDPQTNDPQTNDPQPTRAKITVRELTRGSAHKLYNYSIERIELDVPARITIGDKIIEYKYQNVIKKINPDELIEPVEKIKTDETEYKPSNLLSVELTEICI